MLNDPQLEALRVPPHSVEAEQSVLGGLLLDNSAWDRIADLVARDDFYRDDHRLHLPPHLRADRAQQAGRRGHGGRIARGERGSSTRSAAWPTSARWRRTRPRAPTSAATPRSCASARCCGGWRRSAPRSPTARYNPLGQGARPAARRGRVARSSRSPKQGARGQQGFQEIQPLLTQVVERIDLLYNRDNPSDVTGVPTGFIDLDQMTSGLQPGDLVIDRRAARAWARPRSRSTSPSTSRLTTSLPVAVFSMEMGGHAARHAHARLGRAARPAQAAHRALERRRLAAADRRAWAS